MVIKKIPAGTRIYLTNKNKQTLYIQPDKTLADVSLYVAYDVKVDGETVIPKGTRVVGDWVTESDPTLAAQLQLKRIYLQGSGQDISADSNVIEAISPYNSQEVCNAPYLYKQKQYVAQNNLTRRIVNANCMVKTLRDDNWNIVYLEIPTKEIPVTLTKDFIPFPYWVPE